MAQQQMNQAKQTGATKANIRLRPLGDRVLVCRLEAQEKLKGGIIVPDSAKKKQEEATVVAVGPGKKDKEGRHTPPPVTVGDKILMDKYAGQEVAIDDKDYVILRSDDIIAVIQN